MTLGFLLARNQSGEWTILEHGPAADIRQKYKALVVSKSEHVELFYASMRGDVKRKVWRKRIEFTDTTEQPEETAEDDDEPEEYTGEEEPQPAKKRTRKGK